MLPAVREQCEPEGFVSAARFQNRELAWCRIFGELDQIETRVHHVLDIAHGAEDVPLNFRTRIANDVQAELESIAIRGRRL